jgi:hypothetical protein
MPDYNVVLVQPPGYVHAMCFVEIGRLLVESLRTLGYASELRVNRFDAKATNVVLGYHLIPTASVVPPCRLVMYQLEQLSDREGWFRANHLAVLRRAAAVWDYSEENIAFLRPKGIEDVRWLPIGFHEALATIPTQESDVDVLFYGSVNPRRAKVLEDLARDCSVKSLFGVYGDERDAWIARSKIVLNIHYYEAQILEQARLSYLVNNGRFVVSEQSKLNPFGEGIVTAPYERLAETCRVWLERPAQREEIARTGQAVFRTRPMTEYLRSVL